MKFSIITVCYNSSNTIVKTIESVLAQTFPDIEYIVVDGKSSDGTQDFIRKYEESINIFITESDSGIYHAMNKGIEHSTGDIIGILNSDDVFHNNEVIENVAKKFKENIDIVFGDLVFFSPDHPNKVSRYYSGKGFSPWQFRFGNMPAHPATFIRKSVYLKHGLYNQDYQIAADFELLLKALYINKLNYRWIEAVLINMREGGASTKDSKSKLLLKRESIRACRENGIYTNYFMLGLKFPVKIWSFLLTKFQRKNITDYN